MFIASQATNVTDTKFFCRFFDTGFIAQQNYFDIWFQWRPRLNRISLNEIGFSAEGFGKGKNSDDG